LATLAIVAGCGGSGATGPRVVAERSYSVELPASWKLDRGPRLLTASQGDAKLEVRRYPLRRAYAPALFDKVRPEIDRVAHALGLQLKATATGRTLPVSGEKAWQYDFVHDDVFEQLTFVLRGRTEYQLYCRRAKGDANRSCERLVATFRLR
jgi:hypothetical protein